MRFRCSALEFPCFLLNLFTFVYVNSLWCCFYIPRFGRSCGGSHEIEAATVSSPVFVASAHCHIAWARLKGTGEGQPETKASECGRRVGVGVEHDRRSRGGRGRCYIHLHWEPVYQHFYH